MKSYLSIFLFCLLSITAYSQDKYLQVFSSGGGETTVNGTNLQGTIGEAIIFEASSNFTQGFNQPMINPICDTLAKLLTSTNDKALCLNEDFEVELKYSLDQVTWHLKEAGVQASSSKDYTFSASNITKDTIFATVEHGFCKDTSELIAVEVFSKPEILFKEGNDALCSGEVMLELSIPAEEIQWLLDDEKIHDAKATTYKVLVAGTYSAEIPNSSCANNIEEVEVTSDLSDIELEENEGVLSAGESGIIYQWYIELEGKSYGIVNAQSATYTPLFNGNYHLEIKTAHCQGVSSAYDFDDSDLKDAKRYAQFTGDNMVTLNNPDQLFSLFPNPTHGQFTLSYLGTQNIPVHVELFNSVGTLVYTNTLASADEMSVMTEQAIGVYLLVAETEGNVYQEKLVIE